jgi:glutathione S-transferase
MALNPNASVPAMVDGDFVLWESNAILQYAADKRGNEAAYPRDLQTRADVNRWLLWESSSWFPSCYVFLVENCVKPLLGGSADASVLQAQEAQFHKLASILDARLAGRDWVAGQGPTIADIALAAPMHLHGWQQLPLAQHQNLVRWLTGSVEQLSCWKKTTVYQGFTTTPPAA